jgi:hypothetical protein
MLIDTKEAARRLGVSSVRIIQLLREARIVGGQKIGGQRGIWIIDVPGTEPPTVLPTARQRVSQDTASNSFPRRDGPPVHGS